MIPLPPGKSAYEKPMDWLVQTVIWSRSATKKLSGTHDLVLSMPRDP